MTTFSQKIGNTVRTYEVTSMKILANLSKDLISRGFDGVVYFAVSNPVGNQRKTFNGMFFRSAETKQFVGA